MTTYKSAVVAQTGGDVPRAGNDITCRSEVVNISSAVVDGDLAQFFIVPKGATLIHCHVGCGDLDTNGSPAATVDLGYSGAQTAFINAHTAPQAGGVATMNVKGAPGFQFTSDTTIQARINGPATGAAGKLNCTMVYTMNQTSYTAP